MYLNLTTKTFSVCYETSIFREVHHCDNNFSSLASALNITLSVLKCKAFKISKMFDRSVSLRYAKWIYLKKYNPIHLNSDFLYS